MSRSKKVTLKQLRALQVVAQERAFRRAAERLGITQPSLSAQIDALEEALGARLLERGRTGAVTTPAGREALRRAREIVAAVDALVDAVAASGDRELRLGVSPTIGPYLLPAAVAHLHRSDPGLRLYIREAPPRSLADQLAEGEHDVIMTHLPLARADLAEEELFRERLLLVVARDHPLASVPEVRREHLGGLEILSLDARYQLHDQVAELCETFGARFQRAYEGTSLDALRLMTGLGMGATFLPALYVRSEIRNDSEVVARHLVGRRIDRRIGLVRRAASAKEGAIARLAQVLRETFSALEAGGMDGR